MAVFWPAAAGPPGGRGVLFLHRLCIDDDGDGSPPLRCWVAGRARAELGQAQGQVAANGFGGTAFTPCPRDGAVLVIEALPIVQKCVEQAAQHARIGHGNDRVVGRLGAHEDAACAGSLMVTEGLVLLEAWRNQCDAGPGQQVEVLVGGESGAELLGEAEHGLPMGKGTHLRPGQDPTSKGWHQRIGNRRQWTVHEAQAAGERPSAGMEVADEDNVKIAVEPGACGALGWRAAGSEGQAQDPLGPAGKIGSVALQNGRRPADELRVQGRIFITERHDERLL